MFTDLVTGDVPGAATYFNPLMRQTIIPCTSGTHPSSPHEGMHAYETDTDRLIKWNGTGWEIVAGSRTLFTPTLTASTTNPTMGTGAERYGWYTYSPGQTITYDFFIKFGTSPSAGTGSYAISIPITAANQFAGGHPSVGTVMMADASAGSFTVNAGYIGNGATTLAIVGSAPVTAVFPWAWAAGDYIAGTIVYPAA